MTVTEFARLGGKARAAKLSKERLIAIARKAGKASGKAKRASKNANIEPNESPNEKQ